MQTGPSCSTLNPAVLALKGQAPLPGKAEEEQQQEQLQVLMAGDEEKLDTIEIHRRALEDLVSANSLFTVAVFVGLSFANPSQLSLENRPECRADQELAKRLVLYEVVSFSLFLLSSLAAKTLKVHLNVYGKKDFDETPLKFYRVGMLLLSGWASILGCIFLTLSMFDVIQIRIGKLSCGSIYAVRAVGSLGAIVGLAMLIYAPLMMHAIYRSTKHGNKNTLGTETKPHEEKATI